MIIINLNKYLSNKYNKNIIKNYIQKLKCLLLKIFILI